MSSLRNKARSSFTLIELLVVLALVAILSVVVVITLNPAELIKQARDSNRLSDLSTINTALNLFSADVTSGFMGTSTVVYVSVPDTSPTCANLGLPSIPTSTYTYNCVTVANLRNTNGTGWIPVNFQRISSNSPISQLPIDPQNTTSTKYYTYVTGGSWKVIATPESVKYTATAGTDGGSNIGQFEVGNNMSLAPFVDGLVGWWKFDEGSGTSTTADSSGYGNNGTWNGTSTSRYAAGKVGQYAGYLNGSSDYVSLPNSGGDKMSMSFWFNKNFSDYRRGAVKGGGDGIGQFIYLWNDVGNVGIYLGGEVPTPSYHITTTAGLVASTWFHSVWTYDKSVLNIYINGININSINAVRATNFDAANIYFGLPYTAAEWFKGNVDDVRIYNRILSSTEVTALYNATK